MARAKLLWQSINSAAVTRYLASYVGAPLMALVYRIPVPFGLAEGAAGMSAAAFSVLFFSLYFGLGVAVLGAIGGGWLGSQPDEAKRSQAKPPDVLMLEAMSGE